ncbi:PAS domain S-box protein [uncultured Sphaerotilus sp.]|uniref:PAS domain S-box protein n=1 Tax=uncultured Sphaerotilus sp. TaxID=474984 RepID=UPI0030CA2EF3
MSWSFRVKTIVGVALIEAVLLAILVVSGVRYLSDTAESEFEQRSQATIKAFSVVAKEALISSDLAALNALTREMLTYPGVTYARVRDENRQVLAQAGEAQKLLMPSDTQARLADVTDGIYRVTHDVKVDGQSFGRVEIGLSATQVQHLKSTATRFGLGLAGLEMLLVALFSWALGAYLTRQLGDLSDAAKQIADGDLGYQVKVRGQDELAETAQAFNRMSLRLSEGYTELQRSEQGLRRVLENILDGILTLDRNLRVLSMSPAAERILQRHSSQAANRSLAECFTPPAWSQLCDTLSLEDPSLLGEPLVIDGVLPDGRLVPLEVRLTRIEATGPATLLVVVRDVSERLEAERALRLRGRIIDSIGVGVVIADARKADQPIIYTNVAFERMTGWRFDEVVGQNCRFLQGAGTDRTEIDRLRRAISEGRDIEVLLLNYTKTGQPFWNELRVMAIHNAEGRLTHYVALQNDVTARNETQQQIARSEEQLRRVLNATHDGIVVIDETGSIETFNVGAEKMFGYSADEVIGRNVSVIVPELHRSQHDGYIARYLSSGQSGIMGNEREFEARRKDGEVVWIALRVGLLDETGTAPAPAPADGRRRFIGVIHDITDRKRAEIELRHAKEAAEDAASAKSEFLANMSHEIRTPMHGVLGAIEMLQDTPMSGQQERFLNTARTSASLLLGVIDEILDFSRLEAGKLRIEALDFDLRRTVEDVTAMLAQRAHAKKLELACYIAPGVPEMVRSDPIRVRQVLVNLVGNAIKFTERGEVVVSVGLVAGEGGVSMLRFEVRDTGIGIARDKQSTLFQPFTQADSSTSRRFGGSGLGLSIAKRLVELMNGHIDIDSQEGQGSRFWFTLPMMMSGQALHRNPNRNFPGTRVLVVDDNATNRIILHRYLTSWSSQSSSASSGDEALAKLQDAAISGRPYEVALLDLNMPGMDGYALVRQIQSDPALAAMPLIMLSSAAQDPVRMKGLRVDIWLDKPVRQSDLHDAISTVLHRHIPAPEAPTRRAGAHFSGEQVLLVEDNPITREVGAQMLRKRGLEVSLAEDGLQAVRAIQEHAYDIVLMDIQMPGLDGYDATRAVREWELTSGRERVPIIALTAHALPADRQKCLAAGMDDYVVKPYSTETVSTVIARWLMPPGKAAPAGQVVEIIEEPATAVIDLDRYEQVRAIMGDAMGPLLEKVLETLDSEIMQMQAAAAEGRLDTMRELLHRLKNTAGDIGAMRLHELAAQFERDITRENASMPDIGPLELACTAALAAVRQLILELPSPRSP